MSADWVKPLAYGLLNVASATGIVFANKAVFSIFHFNFPTALTLIHTLTSILGMGLFLKYKFFERKEVPRRTLVPLAAAYIGYIVLGNLNLKINPVGFYQITKLAVAPAVLGIDTYLTGRKPSPQVTASVFIVVLGVGLATITDPQLSANVVGITVGFGCVAATALYQVWAGMKQKELGLGSMQLLDQFLPTAAYMLTALVPMYEPMGFKERRQDTLLGYEFSVPAIIAIAVSSVLGLLVNLSTFLVIRVTSSLTYNIVGHVKTVLILSGGYLFFDDVMTWKKIGGISVAMGGIVWYSQVKLMEELKSKVASVASTAGMLPPKDNLVVLTSGPSGVLRPDVSNSRMRSPRKSPESSHESISPVRL